MGLVLFLIVLHVVYAVARYTACLRYNIAQAKKSGLPYIVVPWITLLPIWHPVYKFLNPILTRLPPQQWWNDRLDIIKPDFLYRTRQKWFTRLGDVFLVVAADKIILNTANAEAIRWVMSRQAHFPKWLEIYDMIRVFGPNVVTTEGREWRLHRRLIAASFSEANAALVFQESVKQTQSMLNKWISGNDALIVDGGGVGEQQGIRLTSVNEDVSKLSMHIISYVGFGLRMFWPGETLPEDTEERLAKYSSLKAPPGYGLSFLEAMNGVLEHIFLVLGVSIWLLEQLPLELTRRVGKAAKTYLKYSNELLDERLADAGVQGKNGKRHRCSGMDLLGHLASTGSGPSGLSREAMVSNAFILQVAGHETTANTLYFTLVHLACFPETQWQLQKELDDLVGDSDPSTWDYSKVVNGLLAGTAGASLYETLRLMPPVAAIPKVTFQDQPLVVDGQTYMVPKGTILFAGPIGPHTNPRYWPTRPSRLRPGETDVYDFVAERWLGRECTETWPDAKQRERFGDAGGSATGEGLFRPVRGSFIPFSDGARSCLGRRFAQTEIMAALAVLFSKHSIELVVDDEDLAVGKERGQKRYLEARKRALHVLRSARMMTTLKLADGQEIGMRIVRRGEERFTSR